MKLYNLVIIGVNTFFILMTGISIFFPIFSNNFSQISIDDTIKGTVSDKIYLPVIVIFIFIFLNMMLFRYKKLFNFIEEKNWEGLMNYLYKVVFENKKINFSNVELYIRSCLFLNKIEKIWELKDFLKENNKKILLDFSSDISIYPMIYFKNDAIKVIQYCNEIIEISKEKKKEPQEWILFEKDFSLIMLLSKACIDEKNIDDLKKISLEIYKSLEEYKKQSMKNYVLKNFQSYDQEQTYKDFEESDDVLSFEEFLKNKNDFYLIKEINVSFLKDLIEHNFEKNKNNLIQSIYIMVLSKNFEYPQNSIDIKKDEFKKKNSLTKYQKKLENEKSNLQTFIFSDILEKSKDFIYS